MDARKVPGQYTLSSKQTPNSYAVLPELYDQSIPQIATAKVILNEFLNENPFKGTEHILDVCCGTGLLSEYLGELLPSGHVIGLDNADNMISFAREHHSGENVLFEKDDITAFNPLREKSADLIVCSWAVSHIPSDLQQIMVLNLYRYLKEDGKLLVLFPVMGSVLSSVIQEVAKSDKWQVFFKNISNTRVSYTKDGYDALLKETMFTNRTVQEQVVTVSLKNKDELTCFITTAVARYLPYIEEYSVRANFINEISEHYLAKIGLISHDIPYSVTMLIAAAKRPALSCLLKSEPHSQDINPVTNKEYLVKKQYVGITHFQHRTKIFDYGSNVDLRQWEAEQYTSDFLPFLSCQFDVVLAHNVIYHSSDPANAIESIKRTLNPNGFLGLSVLNSDVNKAIWNMAHEIDKSVPDKSFTSKFSDIEADKVLSLFFSKIEKRVYENQLHFTKKEPIVNMIKSSPVVQTLNLPTTFFNKLEDMIDEKILNEGELVSKFNASLYLCRK